MTLDERAALKKYINDTIATLRKAEEALRDIPEEWYEELEYRDIDTLYIADKLYSTIGCIIDIATKKRIAL